MKALPEKDSAKPLPMESCCNSSDRDHGITWIMAKIMAGGENTARGAPKMFITDCHDRNPSVS